MEINNRTVRLLSQTNNFTDENLWSFLEENFDLKLKSKQFLLKNKFILLDYNIIKALKNNDVKELTILILIGLIVIIPLL